MSRARVDFYVKDFQLVDATPEVSLLRVSGLWRSESPRELGTPVLVIDRGKDGHHRLEPLPGPEGSISQVDAAGRAWRAAFSAPAALVAGGSPRFALQVEPDVHVGLPAPTSVGGPARQPRAPLAERVPARPWPPDLATASEDAAVGVEPAADEDVSDERQLEAADDLAEAAAERAEAADDEEPAAEEEGSALEQARAATPPAAEQLGRLRAARIARADAERDADKQRRNVKELEDLLESEHAERQKIEHELAAERAARAKADTRAAQEAEQRATAERQAQAQREVAQQLERRLQAERATYEEAERAADAYRQIMPRVEERLREERQRREQAESRAESEAERRVAAERAVETHRRAVRELEQRLEAERAELEQRLEAERIAREEADSHAEHEVERRVVAERAAETRRQAMQELETRLRAHYALEEAARFRREREEAGRKVGLADAVEEAEAADVNGGTHRAIGEGRRVA